MYKRSNFDSFFIFPVYKDILMIFVHYLQRNPIDVINKTVDKHFEKWFENFRSNHQDMLKLYKKIMENFIFIFLIWVANEIKQVTDPLLQSLAWGPSMKVIFTLSYMAWRRPP